MAHMTQIQKLQEVIEEQSRKLKEREAAEVESRKTLHQRVVSLAKVVDAMSVKVWGSGGAAEACTALLA